MLISLDHTQINETTFDVCIVGAGPIGIILALELVALRPDFNILLLEFGGQRTTRRNILDESIEVKNLVNHYAPYECNNKGLGGTSITWGGRCVQYDEIDFIPRPPIANHCTWDLSLFTELTSYADKTAAYFQCGSGVFDLAQLPGPKINPIAEGFISDEFTDTAIERWSLPVRFGQYYQQQLLKSPTIHVLLNCECRSFTPPDEYGNIPSLVVRDTASRTEKKILAKQFVLTAGGIESTRLLLKNQRVFRHLKQPPFALGRYYQGHLGGKIATVQFYGAPRTTEFGFRQEADGTYIRRRLQLTPAALLREKLLNTVLWLDNPPYFDPSHRSGAQSVMYLAMITPLLRDRLAPPSVANSITNRTTYGVGRHIGNVLKDLPESLLTPLVIFAQRYLPKRKLPGVFLYSSSNTYALYFQSEQIPSANNRIELSSDRESLLIHYEISDTEIASVLKVHDKLAKELQENNCGELNYCLPRQEIPALIRSQPQGGIHQVGTTRIANSEADGVVDPNLKVFGTENLFVCSSSILPISGQANPTFIVGEFSIRLAHFLGQKGKAKV